MQKRVIIVHGWEGSPKDNWLPWLKKELEKQKITVIVPTMPDTDEPVIEEWLSHLKKIVGVVDQHTYFVGHSIGVQAIMRFLALQKKTCGGCLFVAGWFHLTNLEEGSEEIAAPWLDMSIDFVAVKKHAGKIIALFSDNDPHVPLIDEKLFKERLDCETIIVKQKDHFTDKEEPNLLPLVKRLIE